MKVKKSQNSLQDCKHLFSFSCLKIYLYPAIHVHSTSTKLMHFVLVSLNVVNSKLSGLHVSFIRNHFICSLVLGG